MDALTACVFNDWKTTPPAVRVFAVLGALLVVRAVLHLASAFLRYFVRPSINVGKLGTWALVTGATDGIGKALAIELARRGMAVALISRTPARLESVRDEIRARYPNVQVKLLAADLARADDPSVRATLAAFVADLEDIGVLYNNVGISYEFPQYFHELSDDRIASLIALNVTATMVLTKLVLPGMAARKRGAIINTSSGSGRIPAPLLSVYAGTKRALEHFSLCLAAEYQRSNVSVQCHTPMFVTTKLAKIRRASFSVPTPATYARASVSHIGHDVLVSPYWPHALQLWGYEHLPEGLVGKVAMSMHLDLRKRALKKLADKKAE